MTACLIVEPIHPAGIVRLESAGISTQAASAADSATIAREIRGFEAVITRSAGLDRAGIEAGQQLLAIGSHGTGVDRVDVVTATRLGIPVVNAPGVNVDSVAELAVGLILAAARRIPSADRAARGGDRRFKFAGGYSELRGKIAGVVGFGAIGRRLAEILRDGFGMQVLVWSPSVPLSEITSTGHAAADGLEALLTRADVVSVHTPRRPGPGWVIGEAELRWMKPGAILVVTSRGGIVDEVALASALSERRIAAAALDVLEHEPIEPGHPLLNAEGLVLTPHIGGTTEEALARTAVLIAGQVIDVLSSRRPEHLVNAKVWECRRLPTASTGTQRPTRQPLAPSQPSRLI